MRSFVALLFGAITAVKLSEGAVQDINNGSISVSFGNIDQGGRENSTQRPVYTGIGPEGEEITVPYELNWLFIDKKTPVIYVEDDNGNLQKGILAPPPVKPDALTPADLREKVRFHLYTRGSSDSQRLWVDDPESLKESNFNPELETKFIIHGYTNTILSPAIQKPKDAYLVRGSYNVIGVDWGDLCKSPWYWSAAYNTIPVGGYVSQMIKFLITYGKADPMKIHIVGHSLGAHVSGIAGYNMGSSKIARITGLDPAGPLFYKSTPKERKLDESDANYVDVLHTCIGLLPNLGFKSPLGSSDFYINGGVNPQPRCNGSYIERISCSHSYAHVLWTRTINQSNGWQNEATECATLDEALQKKCGGNRIIHVGENSEQTSRGIFGVWTHYD